MKRFYQFAIQPTVLLALSWKQCSAITYKEGWDSLCVLFEFIILCRYQWGIFTSAMKTRYINNLLDLSLPNRGPLELRTRSLVSDSSIRNMRKLSSTCSETRRCLGFVAVHASIAYALSVLEKRLKAFMIILCILAVWGQGTDIRRRFNYSRNVSYILPHLLLEKIFSFRSIFYSLSIRRSLTSLELGLSRGKISFTRSVDIF